MWHMYHSLRNSAAKKVKFCSEIFKILHWNIQILRQKLEILRMIFSIIRVEKHHLLS